MRAIVYTQYGGPEVLQLKEVATPSPKAKEILVRVHATAVNSGDVRIRKADPFAVRFFFGLTKPKKHILGSVLSGEVEKVGEGVTRFKAGDQVFGVTGMGFGAYATYKCLPEEALLAVKPANITHAEAAVIPFGGTTALHFIKKANIKPGQKVLVYGASGSVGVAAVQLAKHKGAIVTAVCSTANVEWVGALGAHMVIDYTKEDFTKGDTVYDVIIDTVNKISYSDSLKVLSRKGILILSSAELPQMLRGLFTTITSGRKVLTGVISQSTEDIAFLKSLVEKGEMTPVIDKTYALEEMAEAHSYVEKGHKKGNVAVMVS